MSFDRLGLRPELLRAVSDEGYTEPTPVQAESIPVILEGRDLLAGAQTGTGKTAAFVLPILQRLWDTRSLHRPQGKPPIRVLVLVPTRELAIQVEESVRVYGAHAPSTSAVIYGGVGYEPQVRALRRGPEVVVATPGRLLDHLEQRNLDLGAVEILVLDEADRMLDMGFIRDIRRVISVLPQARQNLLFSATFTNEIRGLADGILRNPAVVQVTPRNTAAELVRQVVFPVDRERKRELLSHLVRSGRIDQALVFTRTKHGANRLAEQLGRDGIAASAIHGNRSQSQRIRALGDFKAGRVAILVATEVAARGLDIESLPHVVNYELPMTPGDYVHRIGRTGRAGVDGDAISLVCVDETSLLREIEALLRHRIPTEIVAGFEPDRSIRAEPIRLRTFGGGRPMPQQSRPRPGVFNPHQERPRHVPRRRPGKSWAPPAAARPSTGQRPGAPHPSGGQGGNGGNAARQFTALPGERLARQGDRRPANAGWRPDR
ncbi:MAG: DEAD/DEAH box helicase [Chloroflexi bacterium]|nr:DEAD/DEAH box helicase [Chloroflexota bacterium]